MTSSPVIVEEKASTSGNTTPASSKPLAVTTNKIETVTLRLEERIASGEWEKHGNLPPQSQFAREYGVSLGTIAIVFRNLHKKGRINLVPYKGATVAGASRRGLGQKLVRSPMVALRGSYVRSEQVYRSEGNNISLVEGVINAAEAEGSPLLLLPQSPDGEAYDHAYYRTHEIRGTIFLGVGAYHEALALRQEGFPVLLANRPIGATPLNYIDYDHGEVLRKAVDFFHENGHRRIAVLSPPTTTPGYFNALLPEFLAHLASKGNYYDITEYWRAFTRSEAEDYEPHIQRLFSLDEPPTAILCLNRTLVAQVMNVARYRGIQIPGDLSLLGSCFSAEAEMSVSGFVLPHKEMGKCLLHEMYEIIENPFHCVQKQLSAIFVDKQTVGPVKLSRPKPKK